MKNRCGPAAVTGDNGRDMPLRIRFAGRRDSRMTREPEVLLAKTLAKRPVRGNDVSFRNERVKNGIRIDVTEARYCRQSG